MKNPDYLIPSLLDYMNTLVTFLSGKKTYLLSAALLAYAIGGYFTGHLTITDALGLIWGSGTVASIRAAIEKAGIAQ